MRFQNESSPSALVQQHRLAKGGMTRDAIAKQLGIGVASVYRVLKDAPRIGQV